MISERELRKLCRWWQKVLRLQDWIIEVAFVRYYGLQQREHLGECEWLRSRKTALIRILIPEDEHPGIVDPAGTEGALVHELLHLHFCPFMDPDPESDKHMAQEQAINAIAQALVRLKQKGGKP